MNRVSAPNFSSNRAAHAGQAPTRASALNTSPDPSDALGAAPNIAARVASSAAVRGASNRGAAVRGVRDCSASVLDATVRGASNRVATVRGVAAVRGVTQRFGSGISSIALALGMLVAGCVFGGGRAHAVCGTPGKDGVGPSSGIVNTYFASTDTARRGDRFLRVATSSKRGNAANVAPGDLLLLIQMQDAVIDPSNSAAYGGGPTTNDGSGVTNLASIAFFEYVRVRARGVGHSA